MSTIVHTSAPAVVLSGDPTIVAHVAKRLRRHDGVAVMDVLARALDAYVDVDVFPYLDPDVTLSEFVPFVELDTWDTLTEAQWNMLTGLADVPIFASDEPFLHYEGASPLVIANATTQWVKSDREEVIPHYFFARTHVPLWAIAPDVTVIRGVPSESEFESIRSHLDSTHTFSQPHV